MTSSKERLRLAHELLDRELQNSTVSKKSYIADDSTKPWSFEVKKQSTGKSEISELQRKLMELEKKMEDIECSSDNQEPQIFLRKLSKSKERENPKSARKKEQWPEEQEDSADDNQIYKQLENIKNKRNIKATLIDKKQKHMLPLKQSTTSLRDSAKSRKSSSYSQCSKKKTQQNSNRKMVRSSSKQSIRSLNKSPTLKHLQLQNAKDTKKISNLQKQLERYKRLCHKQKQKLEDYRVMQIQYKKLQINYNKSEQIRKQQKKIIEGFKNKN